VEDDSKTYTVLVIEDNQNTSELLAFNLAEAGFQVFQAVDAEDALKKLDIVTVDLIVCDIMMPGMDGFTFRDHILADPVLREIPFIFLTAKLGADDQIRGLGSGVDEYITKPFDPQVLVARIHAVLRRHENMARLVRRDPLTQLLNRNTLEREIIRELERIKRYPAKACFVFLDIDEFKEVNDAHGHATGDRALIRLASVLTKDVRSVDIVGRYGGEEFVLYFPESSPDTCHRILDRMHAMFQHETQLEIDHRLTFSAGIAEVPADGADFATLYAHADQAMYGAKRQGKGRTLTWRAMQSAETPAP
jgi:diguanylate cyclase (GGDEF)-like protein